MAAVAPLLSQLACPTAHIFGADSTIVTGARRRRIGQLVAPGTPLITLPDCGHHVLADQPLALVDAIQALLDNGFPRE